MRSERTKAAMADPAVRQKMKASWADPLVRERRLAATKASNTKASMAARRTAEEQAAEERHGEMIRLCNAWQSASVAVRKAFIAQVIGPLLAGVS